jgi:4-amino-4-deoxy-L-arabinose transferase-like glycosyltransferase
MASYESKRQDQDPGQIQNPPPGAFRPPQPPAPTPGFQGPPQPPAPTPGFQGPPRTPQQRLPYYPQPQQPPVQQAAKQEKDESNLTLFRTANFFVHAFTPRSKNGAPQPPPEGTILERIRWTSAEKQRLVEAQTRLLPQIDTYNASKWREIAIPVWLEGLVVAIILAITLSIQALNIFNTPAYTADEGNVMANAWAILQGKITPYTYSYDHPPIGWIQIAGWARLTGGISSFGTAINSGRVFMLILAVASSLFIYLITSRMSGSRSAALLAMVLYSLSPLSLIYRHEVLLDNIGMFWLLLSLTLITTGKSKLGTFALAGVALGGAILTEGLFLFFLPVMLYAVSLYATSFQRKFSLVAFVYITLAIASAYVLLALLKGELLPAGGTNPHPSLIGTLLQKLQTPVVNGEFASSWNSWLQTDMIFVIAGTVAMFINILAGIVNRFQLLGALFAVTFWVMLLAGRSVDPFFIVLLLPFLALNIALALNNPLRWLTRKAGFDLVRALLLFILIGVLISSGVQGASVQRANNEAEPQRQALLWLRDNAPHTSVVITNSYLYADLHDQQEMGVNGSAPFNQAQIYTNAVLDPAIANGVLNENWQKIDFLVVDPTMLRQIRDDRQYRLLNEALHHAILKAQYGSASNGTQILIYQVIH